MTVDSQRKLPPGPTLTPEQQQVRWAMHPLSFLEEQRAEHGDVFTVQIFDDEPWVMVADPELVGAIFSAPAEILEAGASNRVLSPLIGPTTLLRLEGAEHMKRRRLLLPPFQHDRARGFAGAMREAIEAELDPWPTGSPLPAWPRMHRVTLEAILAAVLGGSPAKTLQRLRTGILALRVPAAPGERLSLAAFGEATERAAEILMGEVRRRRANAARGPDDVLELLLSASHLDGSPLTDAEVRDETLGLLIAGHETTATALAWSLERLAASPAALAKVAAEADDGGGPYTDATIRETLRIRPVLPFVTRSAKQAFQLGAYLVPPGTTIAPSILLIHHRDDIYPEPSMFRPERFLDSSPPPFAWIPFGGGVRRCIGATFAQLEVRVVLATLLAHVSLKSADTGAEEPMRSRAASLTPARGGRVSVEKLER